MDPYLCLGVQKFFRWLLLRFGAYLRYLTLAAQRMGMKLVAAQEERFQIFGQDLLVYHVVEDLVERKRVSTARLTLWAIQVNKILLDKCV